MVANTEIKIDLNDDGSWTATSPTYPGWRANGSDSVGSAEIAAKDLELWVSAHTCPICGRVYTAPSALSRSDDTTLICPVYGAREGLEAVGLKDDAINTILETIEHKEIEAGRVQPMEAYI